MEAFREYRNKAVKDLGLDPSDPYDGGYLIGIQHGWRAALELIKSMPDGSCGVRKCVPMEAIRDELEGK